MNSTGIGNAYNFWSVVDGSAKTMSTKFCITN